MGTPVFNPLPTAGPFTSSVPGGVQITTTPADATIFFTTNGTNPTTASTVYSGPISVTSTTTIRAFATKTGFSNSAVAAGTFVINPPAAGQLSDVTITPSTGTYPNPQSVGLTIPAAEAPATICYTLDGATPTCSTNADPNFATPASCTGTTATYSAGAPLQVDAPTGGGSTTVKAIACKNGQKTSVGVTQSVLSFKAAKPTASVPPAVDVPDTTTREVPQNTLFTLSTATLGGGTSIHYRTDGINPNCIAVANTTPSQTGAGEQSCGANTSACLINIDKNYTFKAIACKQNYQASDMATFNFAVRVTQPTLDSNTAATPYFNDKTVVAGDSVTAGQVASTWRCYSTGANPVLCGATLNACTSGSSTTPVVTVNNTTINVDNCAAGYTSSAAPALPGSGANGVVSGSYFLKVAPVSVNPSPGGGTFSNPTVGGGPTVSGNYWNNGTNTSFTLDTATNNSAGPVNVQIHYTVNGVQPTCSTGTVIAKGGSVAPSPMNPFSTIRAIACKTNYTDSDNRVLAYQDPASKPSITIVTAPTIVGGQTTGPTYDNNQQIVITTDPPATGPAPVTNICYTSAQGIAPDPDCSPVTGACTAGTLYNPAAPFTVNTTGFQVKAIACKTGVPQKSDLVEGVYTFKMAAPFATDAAPNCSPAIPGCGSTYPTGAAVTYNTSFYFHSASEPSKSGNIVYRYTTNGTDPTCTTGTPAASELFLPPTNAAVTYKVIACDLTDNFLPSTVTPLAYSGVLAPPSFTPSAGTFNDVTTVNVSSISAVGANGYVCTTNDGSIPSCVGGGGCSVGAAKTTNAVAGTPAVVAVNVDRTTVRAITCKDAGFTPAGPLATSEFRLIVDAPTASPAAGQKVTPVNVAISNGATPGATVCWSIDGSNINDLCTAGGGVFCQTGLTPGQALTTLPPANLATTFTLKVKACRTDFASTGLADRLMSFSPYAKTIVINGFDDWALAENGLPSTADTSGPGGEPTGTNPAYLSWDDTPAGAGSLYFGWRGDAITDDTTKYFSVYLRSPTGPYTTTSDDRLGAGKFGTGAQTLPQIPGGVNYHFFVRTDRNEAAGVSKWDGANWVDGAAGAPINCVIGGQLGQNSALVECKVARASVGLAGANASLQLSYLISLSGSAAHNQAPYTAVKGRSYFSGNMSTNIPSDRSLIITGLNP